MLSMSRLFVFTGYSHMICVINVQQRKALSRLPRLHFLSLGINSVIITVRLLCALHMRCPVQVHFFLSIDTKISATPPCSLIHSADTFGIIPIIFSFHCHEIVCSFATYPKEYLSQSKASLIVQKTNRRLPHFTALL